MLDLRTLALIMMVSALVFFFATFTVWRLVPQERSLHDWMLASLLMAAGSLLLGLRGIVPDLLSIVVGNSWIVLSLDFIHTGTRKLFGLGPGRPWHWLATAAMLLSGIVFTYFTPNLPARIVAVSVLILPFYATCGWLFWRHGEPQPKAIDRFTALIFLMGALLFLLRGANAPGADVSASYLSTRSWLVAAPYLYAILFNVWMTIMLTLKVNARLQQRLEEALGRSRAANQDLAETLAFNEMIILNSPLPMGVYATSGQCLIANDAYARLVGAPRETLLSQNFRYIDAWQGSGLLDDCLAALAHQSAMRREVHIVSSFGKEVWVDCRILPTHLKGEHHLLIQFSDLTERKRVEDNLRNLAFHDALTQLPNRRLLLDRLGHAIRTAKRQNHYVAVLFLDLDDFKALNDAHGHDAGDRLLIEVANRLLQVVRESDTVARLGGDEFVVLLEGLGAEPDKAMEQAAAFADKIQRALSAEYTLGDVRHQCSASIGIQLFLGEDADPDRILKQADLTMYEMKRARQAATRISRITPAS